MVGRSMQINKLQILTFSLIILVGFSVSAQAEQQIKSMFPNEVDDFIMYAKTFFPYLNITIGGIDVLDTIGYTNITTCSNGEILETQGGAWSCVIKPGGGSGVNMWVDNGTYLTPNKTFANSVNLTESGGFLDVIENIFIRGNPLSDIFLFINGSNANQDINISPYNFEANNITVERIFIDNQNHWITKNSDEIFKTIDGATIWIHHNMSHPEGEILFLISQLNRTAYWNQVGKNNSYSGQGNSFGAVPNYWGEENFTEGGTVNMSKLSDYLFLCEFWDVPCRYAADTRGNNGPLLFTTGDLEVWQSAHIIDGLVVMGDSDFIMDGNDFDIFNGSLHIRTPRIEEVGFDQGDNVSLFSENFNDGTISPFVQTTSGGGALEWIALSDANCNTDECARASGGATSPERIMEANFSTTNFTDMNLTFWLTTTNLDSGDIFNVTISDNAGTEVDLYSFNNGTDLTGTFMMPLIPSSMNNLSLVSLRFRLSANNPSNEFAYVDEVKILGNASSSTLLNVTRLDSEILLSDGRVRIFWNDSTNELEFPGNVTFVNIREEQINVTVSIELDGTIITNWGDIPDFLYRNGSRTLTGDWDAGNFDIEAKWFNGSWNGSVTEVCSGDEILIANGSCESVAGYNLVSNTTIDQRINVSNITFGEIVGFTPAQYTGNITNGSLIGYDAANAICNIHFSESHFCLEVEIMKNTRGDYTGEYWMAKGAPGFTAAANDCEGWTKITEEIGPFWNWDENIGRGAGQLTPCSSTLNLTCCR